MCHLREESTGVRLAEIESRTVAVGLGRKEMGSLFVGDRASGSQDEKVLDIFQNKGNIPKTTKLYTENGMCFFLTQ